MKKLKPIVLAALAAGAAQIAGAVNYTATDLMLVFRKDAVGQNDVLFDLGSVSNYLNKAVGSSNYIGNFSTVGTNFGGSLANVKFGAVAATLPPYGTEPLPRVWVTDGNAFVGPGEPSSSKFSNLRGKIENVGIGACYGTSSNGIPVYIAANNSVYAYDYVVTDGTPALLPATTLGGTAPTPVGSVSPLPADWVFPKTITFYELQAYDGSPKPAAQLVGAFTLDVNGNLYFTGGALPTLPPSMITDWSIDLDVFGTSSISFTTAPGVNYLLYYTTDFGRVPNMGAGGQMVNGDGATHTLVDNNSFDPTRFYMIKSTY